MFANDVEDRAHALVLVLKPEKPRAHAAYFLCGVSQTWRIHQRLGFALAAAQIFFQYARVAGNGEVAAAGGKADAGNGRVTLCGRRRSVDFASEKLAVL